MDFSTEIAFIVAKSIKLLAQHHEYRSESDLDDLFRRTIKLFDTDHLKGSLPNDFAFLPNEIVHDIIETSLLDDGCVEDLENLALIAGPWAEFAETSDCSLRFTKVDSETDCEQLKAIAPSLYQEIEFCYIPSTIHEILGLMGTKFTKVVWTSNGDDSDSVHVMDFFKRQLKSNYLRKFRLIGLFQPKELYGLFVEFVKKPQFEFLRSDWLPFEVFEEAHKAWEVSDRVEVKRKKIKATVDNEDGKKSHNTLIFVWTGTDANLQKNTRFAARRTCVLNLTQATSTYRDASRYVWSFARVQNDLRFES